MNGDIALSALRDRLSEHEYRVVECDPITDAHGNIEVTAVYRHGGVYSEQIDLHRFTFKYGYIGEDNSLSLGLSHWYTPSESVGALDLSVLRYVMAYFADSDISVSPSTPLRDSQTSDFDADAPITF